MKHIRTVTFTNAFDGRVKMTGPGCLIGVTSFTKFDVIFYSTIVDKTVPVSIVEIVSKCCSSVAGLASPQNGISLRDGFYFFCLTCGSTMWETKSQPLNTFCYWNERSRFAETIIEEWCKSEDLDPLSLILIVNEFCEEISEIFKLGKQNECEEADLELSRP